MADLLAAVHELVRDELNGADGEAVAGTEVEAVVADVVLGEGDRLAAGLAEAGAAAARAAPMPAVASAAAVHLRTLVMSCSLVGTRRRVVPPPGGWQPRGTPLPGGGGGDRAGVSCTHGRPLRLWLAVSWWLVPLAIIALGAVDLAQNGSLSEGSTGTFPGPVAVHAGFLLMVTVPLCWRFRAPVAVVIWVTVGSAAWHLTMFGASEQPPFEPWLAMLVAVFALASRAGGQRLWAGTAVAGGVFAAGEIRAELAGAGTGNVLPAALFYALIFAMGRMVHAHRQHASGQQDRADRLERDQEARAARAVAAERSRIARELHDVIAHSLSVIVVQAAAERRVLPAVLDSTAETLDAIEHSGRQAMTELRRLLGLLRKDDGGPSLAAPAASC